ncbi:hypothetical protein CCP4SC76_1270002 [Gammaproteobacteria bacterium]
MRVCGVVVRKFYWSAVRNRRTEKGIRGVRLWLIFKRFYKTYHRVTEVCAADWRHGTGLVGAIYPLQDPPFWLVFGQLLAGQLLVIG